MNLTQNGSRLIRGGVMTLALVAGALILPGNADVADSGTQAAPVTQAALAPPATPASKRYGWRPNLFDFGWEYGESLSDRPERGERRTGGWVDYTTGSGRVALHNGAMMIESKFGKVVPADAGPGDRGTTTMVLRKNALTYGRWEIKALAWGQNDPGAYYTTRISLVPEKGAEPACGNRAIVIAEFSRAKDQVRFGAFTPTKKAWRGSARVAQGKRENVHLYAAEVARDHITWFVDGKPVGVLRTKAAIPKVPLTLQIELIGKGNQEMKHTYVFMDWVRGYDMDRGKQIRKGKGLKAGKHSITC